MNIHLLERRNVRRHPNAMTLMWAVLLLILASSWVSPVPAGAHTVLSLPTLLPATIVSPPSGVVAIHGEGFSPGGLVRIAVYNRQAVDMRNVWTVATAAVHGPNGSADPAQGFAEAGTISELMSLFPTATYGPNGSQDPAQGYVGANAVAEDVIYGPNGSQDPAQGYSKAVRLPIESAGTCGQDLIVRGYDDRTSTWSNPIDVVMSC